MSTAILALMAFIAGLGGIIVVQLGVIAAHLGDLKAYTRTQIGLLQEITKADR